MRLSPRRSTRLDAAAKASAARRSTRRAARFPSRHAMCSNSGTRSTSSGIPLLAAGELVAEAMHGQQDAGKLALLFELQPDAPDVHVDGAFVAFEIKAPDFLQQHLTRHRHAGVAG